MTDLAPFDLEGTTAVVTGGGSGIGRAVATEFARRGSQVLVTDVDDTRAETVASEITSTGGAAVWQHLDVTQRDDFVAARSRCLEEFGRVDVVVNNVATMLSGRPEQIPAEEWSRLLDVNVLGIVRSNEVFLPGLIEQGHGHVVNTASTNGIIVYSYDRTPYAASKAAVMMLSEQLFVYLRPSGVGVSCLAPAGVMTNIIEHMRPVGEQLPLRAPDFPIVSADVAGTRVADAVESRAFLVLTADEVRDELRRAGDNLDAYLLEREASLHDEADG
jgi:NAD(P)-dependent dehydrogenase (short-subunit alcohol dehydrogenase family)